MSALFEDSQVMIGNSQNARNLSLSESPPCSSYSEHHYQSCDHGVAETFRDRPTVVLANEAIHNSAPHVYDELSSEWDMNTDLTSNLTAGTPPCSSVSNTVVEGDLRTDTGIDDIDMANLEIDLDELSSFLSGETSAEENEKKLVDAALEHALPDFVQWREKQMAAAEQMYLMQLLLQSIARNNSEPDELPTPTDMNNYIRKNKTEGQKQWTFHTMSYS